jgi:hypothetical protein
MPWLWSPKRTRSRVSAPYLNESVVNSVDFGAADIGCRVIRPVFDATTSMFRIGRQETSAEQGARGHDHEGQHAARASSKTVKYTDDGDGNVTEVQAVTGTTANLHADLRHPERLTHVTDPSTTRSPPRRPLDAAEAARDAASNEDVAHGVHRRIKFVTDLGQCPPRSNSNYFSLTAKQKKPGSSVAPHLAATSYSHDSAAGAVS